MLVGERRLVARSGSARQPMERHESPAAVAVRILVVRGLRELLYADLARIYSVATKAFNLAVRRIRDRVPGISRST